VAAHDVSGLAHLGQGSHFEHAPDERRAGGV